MTTAGTRLEKLLGNSWINEQSNDYRYYSGWSPRPSVVLGQQYRIHDGEAKAFVGAIEARYSSPASRRAILSELHSRTQLDASKGSVSLDKKAADHLNAYAKSLGMKIEFGYNQPVPIHPVG
jgi:hypothetical protein